MTSWVFLFVCFWFLPNDFYGIPDWCKEPRWRGRGLLVMHTRDSPCLRLISSPITQSFSPAKSFRQLRPWVGEQRASWHLLGNSCNPCNEVSPAICSCDPSVGPLGLTRVHIVPVESPEAVTERRCICLLQQKPNSWGRCWWEEKCFIRVLVIWEGRGSSSQSPCQPLSAGRDFYGGRGKDKLRDQRMEVEEFSARRTAQCILIRTWKLVKQWSGVHHPHLLHPGICYPSSVSEGQQISLSWDAWRLESISFEVSF